ncbi:MAG: ribosome small subunit-dependent GTPase A [Bdellovibrionota bacterium]
MGNKSTAIVITKTRRFADLYTTNREILRAKVLDKNLEVAVGQVVEYKVEDDYNFVTAVIEPKNKFERSYQKKTKVIAVNLDLLFVVTAIGPLFNHQFIDRVLATGAIESIPSILIVNKMDLDDEASKSQIEIYRKIGIEVIETSAKNNFGIDEIVGRLADAAIEIVALAGVSGVGKSTILNLLVPSAEQRTNEVSEKTGQGRQTTSQPLGHIYKCSDSREKILIDLPGIQNFGIENFTEKRSCLWFFRI